MPIEAVGLPANLYPGGGFVRDIINPINCEPEEGIEPEGMCKRGAQVRDLGVDLGLGLGLGIGLGIG